MTDSTNPCLEITGDVTASAAVYLKGIRWTSPVFTIMPPDLLQPYWFYLNDHAGRSETMAFLRALRSLQVLRKEEIPQVVKDIDSFLDNMPRVKIAKYQQEFKAKKIKQRNDQYNPLAKYDKVMKGKKYSGGKRR